MPKLINLLTTSALIAGQMAATAPAMAQNDSSKFNAKPANATRPAPAARPAPAPRPAPTAKPAGGSYQKPAGGYQKPAGGNQKPATSNYQKPAGGYQKPSGGSYQKPANMSSNSNQRPAGSGNAGSYKRPAPDAPNTRPSTVNAGNKYQNNNYNNKANFNGDRGGNNNIYVNNSKDVVVRGNNRYGAVNPAFYRPPVNRPPGWYGPGYRPPGYRPPGWNRPPGGYWGPPIRPVGGWGGFYYPPQRYWYDNDIGFGEVFAGVLVAGTLVALLSAATAPQQPQVVYVQGQPAQPLAPPPMYQPPPQASGGPAAIRVDLGALTPDARPSASTCITEVARQIGATGGQEISIAKIDDVEQGNGGYRFRFAINAIYPDATRVIPMYCRATPEKIVELTFG